MKTNQPDFEFKAKLAHDLRDEYREVYYAKGEEVTVRRNTDPDHSEYRWRVGSFYVSATAFESVPEEALFSPATLQLVRASEKAIEAMKHMRQGCFRSAVRWLQLALTSLKTEAKEEAEQIIRTKDGAVVNRIVSKIKYDGA